MLAIEPRVRCGAHIPKRNAIHLDGISFWSRIRESNPPPRLGKPMYYRCTNPAYEVFIAVLCTADTGVLRSCAASVSLRIFFWLCQKLRCCASRPSCGGKMLVIEPASSAWEADVLPMYESCVEFLDIIASFLQKSNRFLAKRKNRASGGRPGGIQQSLAPAGMASSSMTRWSFSSPFSLCTAESSMPHDSWPIIFLGGRLTMAASVLPTRASGS